MQPTFHGIIEPFITKTEPEPSPLQDVPEEQPPEPPHEVKEVAVQLPPILPAGPCITDDPSLGDTAIPFCVGLLSALLIYYAFSGGRVKE